MNKALPYANSNIYELTGNQEKVKILFENCIFNDISLSGEISYSFVFNNCKFKNVTFNSLKIHEHPKFKDYKVNFEFKNIKKIINFKIDNSTFSGKFYINDQKKSSGQININCLTIKESAFNDNFKLHDCMVEKVQLDGIDFEKNADFFKAIFIKGEKSREEDNEDDIVFNSINVKGLSIFESVNFMKNSF